MASTRDIRRRIKSVKNTRQITKAMQLVAASKMKRAQDRATAGIPYGVFLFDLLNQVVHGTEGFEHPLFTVRPVKRTGVLVLSTDRGLCGPLNSNLFRYLTQRYEKETTSFVTVGRKATQFVSRTGRHLLADFAVDEKVSFRSVRVVVEFLLQQFTEGAVDKVEVIYPRFINTLTQEPNMLPLVPFTSIDDFLDRFAQARQRDHRIPVLPPNDSREVKYEPSLREILDELPALFVKQEVYQTLLSAKASEHSARMVAMKAATDNATNLVSDLTLQYNKARQASITQEVLEIAAATATTQKG